MDNQEFIQKIKERIAHISVGPSTVRNQGKKGLIIKIRNFLMGIDLKELAKVLPTEDYLEYLDKMTQKIDRKIHEGKSKWGLSRKSLNLFFRDVVYNKYLSDYLGIPSGQMENSKFIKNLEIPLDSNSAKGLKMKFKDLPRWISIKSLNKYRSDVYQAKAQKYADKEGVARIHLDLIFWRYNKLK